MTDTPFQMPTLAPHLVCDGAADAIEFYKQAFGAQEAMRLAGPAGKLMHAAIAINGAVVLLVDQMEDMGVLGPNALGGSPVTLHLNVANADAAIERAAAAGATVMMPATDMFWGDRYGQVKDPWGHNWSIAHPLRECAMSEDELRDAAKDAMCGPPGAANANA
jgi:PhnB protein